MGGATKARPEDLKPILDGYYKLTKSRATPYNLILVTKINYSKYKLHIVGSYTTTEHSYYFIKSLVDDKSIYLGNNIDSISVLYKD